MKRVLLFFLVVVAILINQNLIFAIETEDNTKTKEIKEMVENLLEERAVLWNDMFSQEDNLDKICSDLEDVVAEPLLGYDIDAFKKLKEEHTNMDKILDLKINKINEIKANKEKIKANIEVEWLMEGLEKNYKETVNYRIKLIKVNEKWKISDYNLK